MHLKLKQLVSICLSLIILSSFCMSNCFAADIVVGAGAVAAGVGAAPVVATVGVVAAGAYAVVHRDEIAQATRNTVRSISDGLKSIRDTSNTDPPQAHSSNKRPSTYDRHTKPRPGRNTEKKKQKPEWRPNPNKRK